MDNLEEIEKFLEMCNLPENINRQITSNEIESVILKLPQTKVQEQMAHRQILPNI